MLYYPYLFLAGHSYLLAASDLALTTWWLWQKIVCRSQAGYIYSCRPHRGTLSLISKFPQQTEGFRSSQQGNKNQLDRNIIFSLPMRGCLVDLNRVHTGCCHLLSSMLFLLFCCFVASRPNHDRDMKNSHTLLLTRKFSMLDNRYFYPQQSYSTLATVTSNSSLFLTGTSVFYMFFKIFGLLYVDGNHVYL